MLANGHVINKDPHQYFTITESAEQELIKATNELHLMYLHATDKVLKDDNLLALFDIPKILWPRLRLSPAASSASYDYGTYGFLYG